MEKKNRKVGLSSYEGLGLFTFISEILSRSIVVLVPEDLKYLKGRVEDFNHAGLTPTQF